MLSNDLEAHTYYVSRIVDLPPTIARAVFDALAGVASSRASKEWHVRAGVAELRISSRPLPAGPGGVHRARAGVIRAMATRMAVELELSAWSADRTELGLRPTRWGLSAWPSAACMRAADEILAELANRMTAWADEHDSPPPYAAVAGASSRPLR